MYNKNTKTVTTCSTQRQQSTRTSASSFTTSRSQTTSTGYVSPYKSSTTTTNRVITTSSNSNNSSKYSTSSTYQPVYNQTRGPNGTFTRNALEYRSLPKTTSSFGGRALMPAVDRLASFGTSTGVNRGVLPTNTERTTAPTSSSWKTIPATSSNAVNNSLSQDARPFGVPNVGAIRRTSNPCTLQQRYDLKKKAYVLIFHHLFKEDSELYRKGSEKDLKLILETFKKYHVKVADPCEDYTVKKVRSKMIEIRKKNFSEYSSVIVIIMSHGGTKEQIRAKDQMYNFEAEVVEQILMNFSLKDKPKLFFVQACKGNALMETDFQLRATNKFDMLKCYSTYEGTVSLRNTVAGTFFIQTLFQKIEENPDKQIIEIMTLIRNEFSNTGIQQTPTETSTLTKSFYFGDLKKN